MSSEKFDRAAMDALLSGAVENGDVPGVTALVFDEGKVVYKNAFGLRDVERSEPAQIDTVYRIYSMTKPVTSALIMDLVEEGKLNLDDPVANYIPELGSMKVAGLGENGEPVFTDPKRAITIKDLLLHKAGIGYGIFGPVNGAEALYEKAGLFDPREDLSVKMTKLAGLPLVVEPGTGWYYSYAIDVLGRVAEVITGERLSDLMQDRFFDPLGMTDTGFYVRPDQKPRFASNYQEDADGTFKLQDDGQASAYLMKPAFESGGGGLVSTLDDYAKFAQMLLQNGNYNGQQILNPKTVDLMMQNHLDPDDIFYMDWLGSPKGVGFGYGGSIVLEDTDGRAKGQFAWGGMARTNFHVDPANGSYAVIMLQFFSADDPPLLEDFKALVTHQVRD